MKLHKTDLMNAVYDNFGDKYTKTELKNIINFFIQQIVNAVKDNGRLTIAPLGTFYNRVRKEREMVSPATGETLQIKEGRVPAFRPSSTIKRILNAVNS